MRTQEERDKEFLNHKPYTGFTYRENLASFRRSKSRIGHPPQPEDTDQTEEGQQLGHLEGEALEPLPEHPSDLLVLGRPVAASTLPNLPKQGKQEVTISCVY